MSELEKKMPMAKNGRYTIGLVVANISDSFSNRITVGAMREAEKLDVNLIVVPAKYVDLNYDLKELDAQYEYQYNALMSHISSENVDYIIACIGTVAYISSDERKLELLKRFGNTPLLCVAAHIGNYDYLQFDNTAGIHDAVEYLVKKCGKRRIGMMVGNLNNDDVKERFLAYKLALAENGLEYDENLIIESDISLACKNEAECLIDRNPDIDAIMCMNDEMAGTVYEVLHERKIEIGRKIAVTGFDDLPLASKLTPPLASVRADAETMGEVSVKKAYDFLCGKKYHTHTIRTKFIPRQSCTGVNSAIVDSEATFCGTPHEIADKILNFIYEDAVSDNRLELTKSICSLIKTLRKYFIENVAYEQDLQRIYSIMDKMIKQAENYPKYISRIYAVIDAGFDNLKSHCRACNELKLDSLYEELSKRVAVDMRYRLEGMNTYYVEERHTMNLVIRDSLMFENNLKKSYAEIFKKIHYFDIASSYLYLFEKSVPYVDKDIFPKNIKWYLKSYQKWERTYTVPDGHQLIPPKMLYSHDFLPNDRRYTYIMADLYSGSEQYGMVLCELKEKYFGFLEYIVYQYSAAVKIIQLLNQQEHMLTELHSKNLVLESMSRIDELTGVYNRRGFYDAASRLIVEEKNSGRKMLVAYADLDNLKMINDSYEHIEGDYAIRSIAFTLKKLFGDGAVVGRMGGDEFSVVSFSNDSMTVETIMGRKQKYMEVFNKHSAKPYRIGFSIGIYECKCEDMYDLKEAIDKADGLLYVNKKSRKKNIRKD